MKTQKFKNRYQANKHAKKMMGWEIKIIKINVFNGQPPYFIIQCNKEKYLMENGEISYIL